MRFLVGRTRAQGRAMSFLQPMLLAALPLVGAADHHPPDQPAALSDDPLGGDDVPAGGQPDVARLRPAPAVADHGVPDAAIAGADLRRQPAAGGRLAGPGGRRTVPTRRSSCSTARPACSRAAPAAAARSWRPAGGSSSRTLETLGSGRWVLIESATNQPRELESPDALLDLAEHRARSSASADLPAMLLAAHDYIQANKSGRTEIWICSDLRENDWNADERPLAGAARRLPRVPAGRAVPPAGLSPRPRPSNLAVRVTDVRRQQTGDGAELLVSLADRPRRRRRRPRQSIPVQFEIDGARSELTVEMAGPKFELKDHRIPLERSHERGWGKVSIPADANPADNDFWFVFDEPAPRQAVDRGRRSAGGPAAAARRGDLARPGGQVLGRGRRRRQARGRRVGEGRAPALAGPAARRRTRPSSSRRSSIAAAGSIFFPPRNPGAGRVPRRPAGRPGSTSRRRSPVENWRGDQDLLAQTQSGARAAGRPAPDPQILRARRRAHAAGDARAAALRCWRGPTTNAGGVYFCATTPAAGRLVAGDRRRRALRAGAARPGGGGAGPGQHPAARRRRACRRGPRRPGSGWPAPSEALSTEYPLHRGRLRSGRAAAGREPARRPRTRPRSWPTTASPGCSAGSTSPGSTTRPATSARLIQEIWRLFLVAMMVAMVVEAGLCLPAARGPRGGRRHERLPIAHLPLDPLVAGALDRPRRWSRPASASSPGGGAAISRAMGLLELLRLALVVHRGRPAQPAGMGRGVPARGEAADRRALGRLAEHGHARRRGPGKPVRRRRGPAREAIAPLAESGAVDPAAGADERRHPAVLRRRRPGTAPTCTSRWPRRSRRSRTCAGIVLASDGDWNEGPPPVAGRRPAAA